MRLKYRVLLLQRKDLEYQAILVRTNQPKHNVAKSACKPEVQDAYRSLLNELSITLFWRLSKKNDLIDNQSAMHLQHDDQEEWTGTELL